MRIFLLIYILKVSKLHLHQMILKNIYAALLANKHLLAVGFNVETRNVETKKEG